MNTSDYYVNLYNWMNTNGRLSPYHLGGYEYSAQYGIQKAMHQTIAHFKGVMHGLITPVLDASGAFDGVHIDAHLTAGTLTIQILTPLYAFLNGVFTECPPGSANISTQGVIYIDNSGAINAGIGNWTDAFQVDGIPLVYFDGASFKVLAEGAYNYFTRVSGNIDIAASDIKFTGDVTVSNPENVTLSVGDFVVTANGTPSMHTNTGTVVFDQPPKYLNGIEYEIYNKKQHPAIVSSTESTQTFTSYLGDNIGVVLNVSTPNYSGLMVRVAHFASATPGKIITVSNGVYELSNTDNKYPVVGICASDDAQYTYILTHGIYKSGSYSGVIYKGNSGQISDSPTGSYSEAIGYAIDTNTVMIDPSHVIIEV